MSQKSCRIERAARLCRRGLRVARRLAGGASLDVAPVARPGRAAQALAQEAEVFHREEAGGLRRVLRRVFRTIHFN